MFWNGHNPDIRRRRCRTLAASSTGGAQRWWRIQFVKGNLGTTAGTGPPTIPATALLGRGRARQAAPAAPRLALLAVLQALPATGRVTAVAAVDALLAVIAAAGLAVGQVVGVDARAA